MDMVILGLGLSAFFKIATMKKPQNLAGCHIYLSTEVSEHINSQGKRGGGVVLGCGWKLPAHLWQTKHFGTVTDSEV